ncbi:MAG TPA: PIG-L deacetylase family protein [Dehalococcoidia bacterium]|nr:PIG-L deacetylase family protein [Dehalococcoidia bacterium]
MPGPILLVFAHPDDESSSVAGTTAKYTECGVSVDLICATRGEKGTRLDVPTEVDTAAAREAGLRVAAGITGIRNIYFLGYVDGDLEKVDTSEIASQIMNIMRKVQPEIVITFGPDGISGHPDHKAISKATTVAFEILTEAAGRPRKLYYVTIPESVLTNVGSEDVNGVTTRPDDEVTTIIDISQHLDTKIRALKAHSSQQDARWLAEIFQQAGEVSGVGREFLYLAKPRKTTKETDIFE